MKPVTLFCFIFLFCLNAPTSTAKGLVDQLRLRQVLFCPDELVPDKPLVPDRELPVPVGCEVIDCCEGCPGPLLHDLQVSWEVKPGSELVLNFDKLDERAAKKIGIEGKGAWIGPGQLAVAGNRVTLKGVPAGVTYRASLRLNQAAAKSVKADLDKKDGKQPGKKVFATAEINQFLGKYVVNNHRLKFRFRNCRFEPGRGTQDKIVLDNNTGDDSAVILFDGRRAGCENDVVIRTNSVANMGNVLANEACRAETFVFSDDNAFAAIAPSTQWTPQTGDEQKFNLQPRLVVPVTVWIVQAGALERAQADIALANELYNTQHVGIMLDAVFTDVSNDNAATDLLNVMRCEDNANIRASKFFAQGRLNLYYSEQVLGSNGGEVRGRACFLSNNEDMVGVAGIAVPETVAHEVGHSCTLRHPDDDGVVYDSPTNLMISGGVNRDNITEGQAFRVNMNINEDNHNNVLRRLGLIPGARNCEENTISAECPDVTLDVEPN